MSADFSGDRRWVKLAKGQRLPEGILTVYTDGACKNNPRGPAGWGWWIDEQRWGAGNLAVGSNNIAELTAIYEVLIHVPSEVDLAIVSDSEYAVMAISTWAMSWERRGWTKADGTQVENQGLIKAAHRRLKQREGHTYFLRVRGHGKDPSMLPEHVVGNEHADRLACEAKERAIAQDVLVRYGPRWSSIEPEPTCAQCGRPVDGTRVQLCLPGQAACDFELCTGCAIALSSFLGIPRR